LSSAALTQQGMHKPEFIFRLFKYTIYTLLAYNAFLFFGEDVAASAETFGANISWRNVIEAFSASIDTSAWIVLLLLFELETAILPDHLLKGGLKWLLKSLSALAYFLIIYSFYGYCYKYAVVSDVIPFQVANLCDLVGSDFTWVNALDEYLPFDEEVCTALASQTLLQIDGTNIIGTPAALQEAAWLAIVDIVNASTWLIIVILLEVEVFLQLRDRLTNRMMSALKYIKTFFYGVLFVCAAYWGFKGSFLDFWDAFLWLVAFIFIELNVFQWQAETKEEREHAFKV